MFSANLYRIKIASQLTLLLAHNRLHKAHVQGQKQLCFNMVCCTFGDSYQLLMPPKCKLLYMLSVLLKNVCRPLLGQGMTDFVLSFLSINSEQCFLD